MVKSKDNSKSMQYLITKLKKDTRIYQIIIERKSTTCIDTDTYVGT